MQYTGPLLLLTIRIRAITVLHFRHEIGTVRGLPLSLSDCFERPAR